MKVVNIKFLGINKNNTLAKNDVEILKEPLVEECTIVKSIHLTEEEYEKIGNSLLDDRNIWGNDSEVVEVTSDNKEPFYVNTEGFSYARHVGRLVS